ncbi:hypothetical protein [Agromyces humi]|uniref:hypothetical protein n=1 Tax=Agromyces humi TaxID=1766800 RepID=UPI001356EF49|nr:hypothetical protein [Agromyces humi]
MDYDDLYPGLRVNYRGENVTVHWADWRRENVRIGFDDGRPAEMVSPDELAPAIADPDMDALIKLELASTTSIASDGHPSIGIRTNEAAAHLVLHSTWLADKIAAERADAARAATLELRESALPDRI